MRSKISFIVLVVMVIAMAVGITLGGSAKGMAKEKPILVGVPSPSANIWGRLAEQGCILAAEEINAAGGVNVGGVKRPIKLEITDDRDLEPGVPVGAVLLATEKLILEKKVNAVIGGPCMSEAGLAVMDLFAKYKVIGIGGVGVWTPAWRAKASKDIRRYRHSFKVTGDAKYWAGYTMKMLHDMKEKHGLNKVYFISSEAAHARAFCKGLKGAMVKDGWKSLGLDINPIATTDFSISLGKATKSGAQLLFVHQQPPFGVHLIKQWADMKVPALLCGFLSSASDPGMWKATAGKVNYVVLMNGEAGCSPDAEVTPLTRPYLDSYVARWKEKPYLPAAVTSRDSLYVLKDAIERAGTLESDALISAIEQTNMVSVSGRLKFDKASHTVIFGNDPKEASLGIYLQWQDGKRVTVCPPAIATTAIKLPPWIK